MSGHAAAPAAAPTPAPEAAAGQPTYQDTVRDLALKIYVQLAGHSYAGTAAEGQPDPKALAMLSFKLAEAFLQAHRDINAILLEAARKRDNFSFNDIDLGAMMKG
jgi:hypothetical protein